MFLNALVCYFASMRDPIWRRNEPALLSVVLAAIVFSIIALLDLLCDCSFSVHGPPTKIEEEQAQPQPQPSLPFIIRIFQYRWKDYIKTALYLYISGRLTSVL